ncbi:MAG: hypothetical protein WD055_06425 [Candidatus Dependentiae bacterium]
MKNITLLALFCSLGIITQISAMDKPSDTAYWNAWASTPLKLCKGKEYIECLQARVIIAKSGDEERKETVKAKLLENENNPAFQKSALRNPDAPIDPKKIAVLMMALKTAQKK